MNKIIFILLLTISVYACQRKSYCERKADKFARLIKDCPNLIDTTTVVDTVLIRDNITVSIPSKVDSIEFDSLLSAYCDEVRLSVQGKTDTVRINEIKYNLRNRYGEGEKMLYLNGDTVTIGWNENNNGLNLSILSVKKQLNKTKTLVVPCPELAWYNDWIKIALATSLCWVVLIFVLRRFSF